MKIGVFGAQGRLGAMILRILAGQNSVRAAGFDASPEGLDAIINAAPLRDAALHRRALNCGCHVIDVTVDRGLIRELLALDDLARQQGRCMMAMAGLSPGLTGLLARDMQARVPKAACIQVSLLQSSAGTAGEQGTREMIDLLTRSGCEFKQRPYPQRPGEPPSIRRLFDLDGPELEFLDGAVSVRLVTGFDSRHMNTIISILALLRGTAPQIYSRLRDTIARRKAQAGESGVEAIELGAVALTRDGNVLASRMLSLASDYGATAAIASASAMLAVQGRTQTGAGHLRDFIGLEPLLDHPVVRAQVL